LDVGSKRVGVAVASLASRLPRPLVTLIRDDSFFPALQDIIESESVETLVVGLPRGLDGQHTGQTRDTEVFKAELSRRCALPVHMQDEAVTSKRAEAELEARGKPYKRGDIDALAATYILEDFLAGHREPVA
jgi:putative Holliday junction resolvase